MMAVLESGIFYAESVDMCGTCTIYNWLCFVSGPQSLWNLLLSAAPNHRLCTCDIPVCRKRNQIRSIRKSAVKAR